MDMRRLLALLATAALSAVSRALAEDARISSLPEPPGWRRDSPMHLQLTAPESEALRLTYSVYPLTGPAGLNQTETSRSVSV